MEKEKKKKKKEIPTLETPTPHPLMTLKLEQRAFGVILGCFGT